MLILVPFHNLELGDSDDPPLGVYIESRFSVNCKPIELLTFPPPVRNSLKGVPVIVYWLLTSLKILEVVVDEMLKRNYTTTLVIRLLHEPLINLKVGPARSSGVNVSMLSRFMMKLEKSIGLAKFCSSHDPMLVVSLARKTIQDAK
nr:hypothetical protein [Tanacetum cinerariifolium]